MPRFKNEEIFKDKMIIDKNSPGNLSERDRSIYERWFKDKWSISYSEYLKTDHWAIVKKENAIRWKVCALTKTHTRLPMVAHHRDDPRGGYPCMWEETYEDVILLCEDCHERYHEIWSENNCKGSRYAGAMIMSIARNIHCQLSKSENEANAEIELFKNLIKNCSSPQSLIRKPARAKVAKTILVLLEKEYHYSHVKKKRKTILGLSLEENSVPFEKWIEKI